MAVRAALPPENGLTGFGLVIECIRVRWGLERVDIKGERVKRLVRQLRPMSWSGSRAAILESNAKLLDQLLTYTDPAVVEFVTAEKARLAEEVERERRHETEHDRDADERFE